MTMIGSCQCNNIKLTWNVIDFTMTPRACQCDYCLSKKAAYVSKPGSLVEVEVNDKSLLRTVKHGSKTAIFHECASCGELVFVTVVLDGEIYGVVNSNNLVNKFGFAEPVSMSFEGQSKQEKESRWKSNWCRIQIK